MDSVVNIVANEEIDITMEVRRLKKVSSWPQLNPVSHENVDELIATEFVAPAAWTGTRPHEEMLDRHLEKAEIDMFRFVQMNFCLENGYLTFVHLTKYAIEKYFMRYLHWYTLRT